MGIPFNFFLKSIGLMVVVVALSAVKIYISNQIYYKSRTINKLESEVAALKEENSILSMNIEKLRYKTEILDSIEIENQKNSSESQIQSKEIIKFNQESNKTQIEDENKTLNQSDIKKLFNKTKESNSSRVDGAGEVND